MPADAQTRTVDQILAGWPSTFDTMGDARKMQEMVEYARQLERELAAARLDAERYRWLRGPNDLNKVYCPIDGCLLSDEQLDAAIDAAKGKP